MAKIPYELDTTDPIGPKGKLPWISFNGTHVADSHLCIEFLKMCVHNIKHNHTIFGVDFQVTFKINFSLDLDESATSEQLAVARACRIMLEERFYWGLQQYRMVEVSSSIRLLTNAPIILKYIMPLVLSKAKKNMDEHGIGHHTQAEIYQMSGNDLRTVAIILRDKEFMGGDKPCEEDCAVFGMVAQAVWGMPGSSFEALVHGDLMTLKYYCERMKELYWPDWNECLDN